MKSVLELEGKISRVGRLKYTPSGMPIVEFTIAAAQEYLSASVGHFEGVLKGSMAEEMAPQLKIGMTAAVSGALWGRNYLDRRGNKVSEVKIIVEKILFKGRTKEQSDEKK